MSDIKLLPIADLDDHPKNPRLLRRKDVIDSIAANLGEGFDPAHALIVRPVKSRYQIISGHHRKAAAIKAGLVEVPCWVRVMSDDEAYMALATDNAQGELGPLEIGMHALHCVSLSAGGRGKKGGLREYAERIGRDHSNVGKLRDAAEVAINCGNDTTVLLDKASHLAAIHKLPNTPDQIRPGDYPTWQVAVEYMLKKPLSAADTQSQVKAALEAIEHVPEILKTIYPADQVAARVFTKAASRKTISELCQEQSRINDLLESIRDLGDDQTAIADDIDVWDTRAVVKERERLEAIEAALKQRRPTIALASCFDWLPDQPQCDLLLTDPPYSTDIDDIDDFAKSWLPLALSKVKPTGRAYIFIGAYPREIMAYMSVRMPDQILVWEYRDTLGPRPSHEYKVNWQAILYYQMPDAPPLDCPIMTEQLTVQNFPMHVGKNRLHTWQKPDELAEQYIRHSTPKDGIILDPFACTGTFILAANKVGRIGLGCEINEANLNLALDRGCERA